MTGRILTRGANHAVQLYRKPSFISSWVWTHAAMFAFGLMVADLIAGRPL